METFNLTCNLLIVRRIITSLEYIKRVFRAYNGNDNRKLVKAKNVTEFKKTIPFETASIYISPDNSDEMIKYAVQSVHNFAFLARRRKTPLMHYGLTGLLPVLFQAQYEPGLTK